jgi:hypothetical protein
MDNWLSGKRKTMVLETYPKVPLASSFPVLLFVHPGELRQAEWTEFDLDAASWDIPSNG